MIWAAIALSVLLSWQDNSDNENGFEVVRNGETIGYTGTNEISLIDPAAQYLDCYQVRAFNEFGFSGWSNTACLPAPPPACKPRGKSGKCR